MNDGLRHKLANELIGQWVVEEIELDQDDSPDNEFYYSMFTTAAKILSDNDQSIEELDPWKHDPNFVTKTTLHRQHQELKKLTKNHSYVIDQLESNSVADKVKIPEKAAGEPVDEDELKESIKIQQQSDLFVENADNFYAIHSANRLLPFLVTSQALIEEYTIEMINEKLVSDSYKGSNNTFKFLRKDLSQPDRIQLLQRTGTLANGYPGKMEEIRQVRNDLTHDLRTPDYFAGVIDSIHIIDNVVDVIKMFESRYDDNQMKW